MKNLKVDFMSDDKSFIAKICEVILKFTKPDYMDNDEKIIEFLKNKSENNKPVKSIFKSININDTQVFTYGDEKSQKIILYVHGGAYVNEINMQHHLYCKYLSRKLKAYVFSPVYPLAPLHNFKETYDIITDIYTKILTKNKKIILMGDSAGGGFILSFSQYLNTLKLPQPDNIIVFSPWVDVSMNNQQYDSENDPILGDIGLKEIGKRWAGDSSTKDYKVSPLYGNTTNQGKTLIFAGSEEIFYKDIKKYAENLKKSNIDVKLITGNGLFHIYPLFPIPEARKAMDEIKKEIL